MKLSAIAPSGAARLGWVACLCALASGCSSTVTTGGGDTGGAGASGGSAGVTGTGGNGGNAGTGNAGGAAGGSGAGGSGACASRSLAGPAMVQIPAGRGEIGSTSLAAAQPVHTVDFQPFCLDRTEVTVQQYLDCYNSTGTNRCSAPTAPVGSPYTNCNFGVSGYDDHPVNCVTWAQADQYCKWAGKRLPTEEEWEYAARGPLARNFPWGNTVPPDPGTAPASSLLANWNTLDTVPVGTYPGGATPEGALDLAGNLWEWIADLYCPTYDAPPSLCSAVNHSARGGSWASRNTDFLRSWYRDGDTAGDARFGFRCAL